MNNSFGRHHTAYGIFWTGSKIRRTLARLGEDRRCVVRSDDAQTVALHAIDISKPCIADADGLLHHCRKHRLKIAGRATDDLKNLRGSRLLLQRLCEVGCALSKVS